MHMNGNTKLFANLSLERLGVGFAGLDLATGEFPHTRKALAGRSATAKKLSVALDDGGDDSDGFHRQSLGQGDPHIQRSLSYAS